jgi:chromosome segregation ATPase
VSSESDGEAGFEDALRAKRATELQVQLEALSTALGETHAGRETAEQLLEECQQQLLEAEARLGAEREHREMLEEQLHRIGSAHQQDDNHRDHGDSSNELCAAIENASAAHLLDVETCALRERVADTDERLAKVEKELHEVTSAKADLETQISTLQGGLKRATDAAQAESLAGKTAEARVAAALSEAAATEADLVEMQVSLAEERRSHATAMLQAHAASQGSDAASEALQLQVDALSSAAALAERALTESNERMEVEKRDSSALRMRVAEISACLEKAEAQLREVSAAKSDLEAQVETMQGEINRATSNALNALEKSMVAEGRAVAASSASAASEGRLVELHEHLAEERRNHSTAKQALQRSTSAFEALRAEADASASAAASADAALSEANDRLEKEQSEVSALRERVVEASARLELIETELRHSCSANEDLKAQVLAKEEERLRETSLLEEDVAQATSKLLRLAESVTAAEARAVAASSASATSEAAAADARRALQQATSSLEAVRADADASSSATAAAETLLADAKLCLEREQSEASALRARIVEVSSRLESVESQLHETCCANADLKAEFLAMEKEKNQTIEAAEEEAMQATSKLLRAGVAATSAVAAAAEEAVELKKCLADERRRHATEEAGMRDDLRVASSANSEMKERIATLDEEVKQLMADALRAQENSADAEARTVAASSAAAAMSAELAEMQERLSEERSHHEGAAVNARAALDTQVVSSATALRAQAEASSSASAVAAAVLAKTQECLEMERMEASNLRERIAVANERLEKLDFELREAEERLEEERQRCSTVEADANKALEQAAASVESLQAAVHASSSETSALRENMVDSSARLDLVESQLRETYASNDDLKVQISTMEKEMHRRATALEGDAEQAESKLLQAEESLAEERRSHAATRAASQESLDHATSSLHDAHAKAERELSDAHERLSEASTSKSVLTAQIVSMRQEIEHAASRAACAEECAAAAEARAAEASAQLAELEMLQEEEIEHAASRAACAEECSAAAEARAAEASSAAAAAAAELAEIEKRSAEERCNHAATLTEAQEALRRSTSKAETLQAQIDASSSSAAAVQATLTEVEIRLKAEQMESSSLRERIVEADTRLENVEAQLHDALSTKAELARQVAALEEERGRIRQDVQAVMSEALSAGKVADAAEIRAAAASSEAAQAAAELAKAQESLREAALATTALKAQRTELEASVQQATSKASLAEERFTAAEARAVAASSTVASAVAEASRLKDCLANERTRNATSEASAREASQAAEAELSSLRGNLAKLSDERLQQVRLLEKQAFQATEAAITELAQTKEQLAKAQAGLAEVSDENAALQERIAEASDESAALQERLFAMATKQLPAAGTTKEADTQTQIKDFCQSRAASKSDPVTPPPATSRRPSMPPGGSSKATASVATRRSSGSVRRPSGLDRISNSTSSPQPCKAITPRSSPPSEAKCGKMCRFCCQERDSQEHMLLRCSMHTSGRMELAKACDNLVEGSWSGASDDKMRFNMLLKDDRVQRPLNNFMKKAVRERDSAAIPGDASLRDEGGPFAAQQGIPFGAWISSAESEP